MPPKRKRTEPAVSPEQESKKETKEERKKRIEAQKIRAKKWAEERKARVGTTKAAKNVPTDKSSTEARREKPKITKRASKSTESSAVDSRASTSSPVKATPKKKAATSPPRQSKTPGRESRKKEDELKKEEDETEEEEALKPRVKRRKLTKDMNKDEHLEKPKKTPATKKTVHEASKPQLTFMSPEAVNNERSSIPVVQTFMSPEGVPLVQDSRSNIVYVPVNVAGLHSVNGKVTVTTSGETKKESFPVFSPVPKNASFTSNIPKVSSNRVAKVSDKNEESTEPISDVNVSRRQTVEVQNEEREQEEYANEKTNYSKSSILSTFMDNFVKCTALTLSISILLFFVTSLYVHPDDSHVSVTVGNNTKASVPTSIAPCYNNIGFGGENEQMDLPCKNPVDCPPFGRCEGGKLVDCRLEDISWNGTPFYEPSETGDKCIPSSSASQAMMHLNKTLIDLSVEYVCRSYIGLGPICRVPLEEISADGSITFHSQTVAEILNFTYGEMNVLLKQIEDNQDIVQHEKDYGDTVVRVVGLSQEYIDTKLTLPLPCYLRILAWDFSRIISTFVYGVLKVFFTLIWSITVSKPIATFSLGAVMYLIFWVYHKRSKVVGLRKESSKIQNIAYDKLIMDCNEGEGYAALHLRDEIAHELYPEQCSARTRFNSVVWPRVVVLIRSDNRVIKTRKTIGGKSLEWWEWVADSSRKSRRSLAASKNTNVSANEGENATT
mmetsp:Transcript_3495/g.6613  ORF Transcript_3495/g.6613 Transcript_3495/m.6613 type:complete len:723 (+) Transcript_3495:63-2231(+)